MRSTNWDCSDVPKNGTEGPHPCLLVILIPPAGTNPIERLASDRRANRNQRNVRVDIRLCRIHDVATTTGRCALSVPERGDYPKRLMPPRQSDCVRPRSPPPNIATIRRFEHCLRGLILNSLRETR